MQANEGGAPLATGRSVGIIRNNPYGPFRKQSRHPDDGGKENENTATAPTTPTAQQQQLTMGIQSQLLMGSVKSNMRKGGKRKQQQSNKKISSGRKPSMGVARSTKKRTAKPAKPPSARGTLTFSKSRGRSTKRGSPSPTMDTMTGARTTKKQRAALPNRSELTEWQRQTSLPTTPARSHKIFKPLQRMDSFFLQQVNDKNLL